MAIFQIPVWKGHWWFLEFSFEGKYTNSKSCSHFFTFLPEPLEHLDQATDLSVVNSYFLEIEKKGSGCYTGSTGSVPSLKFPLGLGTELEYKVSSGVEDWAWVPKRPQLLWLAFCSWVSKYNIGNESSLEPVCTSKLWWRIPLWHCVHSAQRTKKAWPIGREAYQCHGAMGNNTIFLSFTSIPSSPTHTSKDGQCGLQHLTLTSCVV